MSGDHGGPAVPFEMVFMVRLLAPIRGAHSSDSRSMSIRRHQLIIPVRTRQYTFGIRLTARMTSSLHSDSPVVRTARTQSRLA